MGECLGVFNFLIYNLCRLVLNLWSQKIVNKTQKNNKNADLKSAFLGIKNLCAQVEHKITTIMQEDSIDNTKISSELGAISDIVKIQMRFLVKIIKNIKLWTQGAFYEAFEAKKARQLVRWIECQSTAVGWTLPRTNWVRWPGSAFRGDGSQT